MAKQLQRNVAIQPGITSAIDVAEGAAPDLFQDPQGTPLDWILAEPRAPLRPDRGMDVIGQG